MRGRLVALLHLIFALACVGAGGLLTVVAAAEVAPAFRAAAGTGHRGVFELGYRSCTPRGSCDWYGTYVSDDGSRRRDQVSFYGDLPDGAAAGDRFAALDSGGVGKVYGVDGTVWWGLLALSRVLLVWLGAGAVLFLLWRSHRGRSRSAAGLPRRR